MSEEKMNICLCGCERSCKHNKNHWCEECKIEEKPNFWDDLEKIKSREVDEISHSISISGDVKTKMSKEIKPRFETSITLMQLISSIGQDVIMNNGKLKFILEFEPNNNKGRLIINAYGHLFRGVARELYVTEEDHTIIIEGEF